MPTRGVFWVVPLTRCPNCPGDRTCVRPSGPIESAYHFIGEAPGPTEDRKDEPFCGKTGDEVNRHYLPLAGLRRENVYFTNAIRCMPPGPKGKLDPKRQRDLDLLQSCSESHLYPGLTLHKPTLIIPMGAFACRAIDPSIDLQLQHGYPIDTQWGTAFPMYHPAGGIHEPKKMLQIRTDWTRLRKYISRKLRLPMDSFAGNEYYNWVLDREGLDGALAGQECQDIAIDTEVKRGGGAFCLTFCTEPGTGFLIRADQPELLVRFQQYMEKWLGLVVFHNALFDLDILEQLSVIINPKLVRDTMMRVFHLGNMPQGLKALSWRELGMQMQDFDDLVTPYSKELVLDYYRYIKSEDWATPPPQMVRDAEGKWKVYKPQSMSTKIKRFWTDHHKNPDIDVFSRWYNWEDHHDAIEECCGEWPGKCISHVPFDKVIFYACRDADSCLRLWRRLKRIKVQIRRKPQENWGDTE